MLAEQRSERDIQYEVRAITLIGIPFALQHLKLIPIVLLSLGRDLR